MALLSFGALRSSLGLCHPGQVLLLVDLGLQDRQLGIQHSHLRGPPRAEFSFDRPTTLLMDGDQFRVEFRAFGRIGGSGQLGRDQREPGFVELSQTEAASSRELLSPFQRHLELLDALLQESLQLLTIRRMGGRSQLGLEERNSRLVELALADPTSLCKTPHPLQRRPEQLDFFLEKSLPLFVQRLPGRRGNRDDSTANHQNREQAQ